MVLELKTELHLLKTTSFIFKTQECYDAKASYKTNRKTSNM